MKKGFPLSERPITLGLAIAALVLAALFITGFIRVTDNPSLFCSSINTVSLYGSPAVAAAPIQLQAILHYATSHEVPQQSLPEITLSFQVLRDKSPCNFLVFGLGRDSLMWASFNPRGTTLFLEEDPKWVQTVLKDHPYLRAHTVKYPTKLSQADKLLAEYRAEPACSPERAHLKGNAKCRLALATLPEEAYDKEWDLIMIDAPRGYYAEAPGRMGAIYSAAVMARWRRGSGATHVFLHDVDRKVEKAYAEEFLCRKHLVKAAGRLWHFVIPPAAANSTDTSFC